MHRRSLQRFLSKRAPPPRAGMPSGDEQLMPAHLVRSVRAEQSRHSARPIGRRYHAAQRPAPRRQAPALRELPGARGARPRRHRGRDQGDDRSPRHGVHQADLQRCHRQEGQGRPGRQGQGPEDRPGRARAPVLRPAHARQRHRQGAGRHLRGRRAGRSRGLFRDRRFDPVPGAHDHHHPPWRRRHRGAGQGRDRHRAVRGADRPQGVRHRQRAGRHQGARADHLAPGPAPAAALGAGPRFRHDHARAQPDPDAPRRARPADAGRLRLQVRLRPRRRALGAAGPARPPVRRRPVGLRDRDQPAAHPPGPERRLRHQPAAARSWRPPSAAAPTRWSARSWATTRSSPRTSAATRPTRR